MGRARRIDGPGEWHHVMNRGADRQDIFTDDADRVLFEHHLQELDRLGLFETHAYALMTNHFHVLGRTPDGTLSTAMHRLLSEYARYYNERHRRDGPLFRGRFSSVCVDTDEQLRVTARYVHRNPLAFVPQAALANYRWSSWGCYLGTRSAPRWLHRDRLEAIFGSSHAHRDFVMDSLAANDVPSPPMHVADVGLADVAAALATVLDLPRTEIEQGVWRQLAVAIAVELRVASAEDVAIGFGLRSPGAARTMARRGRVQVADDAAYRRAHDAVVAALLGRAA